MLVGKKGKAKKKERPVRLGEPYTETAKWFRQLCEESDVDLLDIRKVRDYCRFIIISLKKLETLLDSLLESGGQFSDIDLGGEEN